MGVYLQEFFSDINVASFKATATRNVEKIISKIPFNTSRVFVEFGPGNGVFTRSLLSRMSADSKLLVVETNFTFVKLLKKSIRDPRLEIVHDSACNIAAILKQRNISAVDYLISGIPLSFMSPEAKQKLIDDVSQSLGIRGRFVVYQALLLPGAGASLKSHLKRSFGSVRKDILPINLPPLYLLEASGKAPALSQRIAA